MARRILLVGGAGFIGTHLARRLAGEGHTVTILDSLHPQVHGRSARFSRELRSLARCIRGDARRAPTLAAALRRQDVVYWLAAETGTGQSMYRVRRYVDVNLGALGTVFDALLRDRADVERLVLTSSRAIYGEGRWSCEVDGFVVPEARAGRHSRHGWNPACPACEGGVTPLPTPESSPPQPGSVYGWTKLGQEQLLSLLQRAAGVETAVLRLQNVFGPGQALGNPYTGVLMTFCNRALRGEGLTLYEDGEIARDFVYVEDAVSALATAGTGRVPGGGPYNIGSGVATTVREAAEAIVAAARSDSTIAVGGQFRVGDIRYAVADLARAAAGLRYCPTVSFADGIAQLVMWVEAQGPVADRTDRAARELAARGLLKTARA
jgi:dTDP-L-rhamnose 4-epimerase